MSSIDGVLRELIGEAESRELMDEMLTKPQDEKVATIIARIRVLKDDNKEAEASDAWDAMRRQGAHATVTTIDKSPALPCSLIDHHPGI